MQIKKYKAKSLALAMEQMKSELGDNAIVLSSREIQGIPELGKSKEYEITAGADDQLETVNSEKAERNSQNSSSSNFDLELEKIRKAFEGKRKQPVKKNITRDEAPSISSKANLVKDIIKDLKKKEVSSDIIGTIEHQLNSYNSILRKDNAENYVMSILSSLIPTGSFEVTQTDGPKIVSLVGPTGVGKTTCIAKLAVISKILNKLDVGLISIDTYRLGALDQLKIFSEISQIEFLVAYEPKDLPKYLKKFKNKDIVFIDTVGRSQNNSTHLQGINDFLDTVKVDEKYLVLSTTSTTSHMVDVAEKFKEIGYNGIILTKLDEAVSYGNVINLVNEVNVPIQYLTNGQVIPDDIISADAEFIARMIYTGKVG